MKIQQVIIKVSGWQEASALSVDKTGVFFRDVKADNETSSSVVSFDIAFLFDMFRHVVAPTVFKSAKCKNSI